MRMNRLRLLMGIAAGSERRRHRGMGGFYRWAVKGGLLEQADVTGWRVRVTPAGREAIRKSVEEYERHRWMGHGALAMAREVLL